MTLTMRSVRRRLQLTQAQMAARLGIGHSTYARYEGLEARGASWRNANAPDGDKSFVAKLPTWLTLAVQALATGGIK
jgi:hypothetical protein